MCGRTMEKGSVQHARLGARRRFLLESGQNGGNTASIGAIIVAKAFQQFLILHSDHEGATDQSKDGQSIGHKQTRADAPGQHFAYVSEVERMSDMTTDTSSDKPLVPISDYKLGYSAQLTSREVPCRQKVDGGTDGKHNGSHNPRQRRVIKSRSSPAPGKRAH